MPRGEDTSHHPARKVDSDSHASRITQTIKLNSAAEAPIITETTSPSGERLRKIGSYTSYVHTPPGGYGPAPKNWRAMRHNTGGADDIKPEY